MNNNTHFQFYICFFGCISLKSIDITYGCEESDFSSEQNKEERMIEAAKFANAHNFIISFKDGYQTMVHSNTFELSNVLYSSVFVERLLIMNCVCLKGW
jgi:ABC-type transport system involved in Fe-S cluster assembly fused permease/ATPase subunit